MCVRVRMGIYIFHIKQIEQIVVLQQSFAQKITWMLPRREHNDFGLSIFCSAMYTF